MSTPSILTFLIADVRGYTAFTATHGDEAAGLLAATFAEIAREAVEARGGDVIELRGDEVLAVFASGRNAMRAAIELQAILTDEVARDPSLPLRVGIGLDAGEAVAVETGYRGAALNLAARLCAVAGPGEVIASQGVLHLAGPVDGIRIVDGGEVTLKGIPQPTAIARLETTDERPSAERHSVPDSRPAPSELPPELDSRTPLSASRDVVARRLRWWWRNARARTGRVVVVTGPPGIGKTRILAEPALLASHDGVLIRYVSGRDAAQLASTITSLSVESGRPVGSGLLVIDDLDLVERSTQQRLLEPIKALTLGQWLVVVTSADVDGASPIVAAARARPDAMVHLAPLDRPAVAEVVTLYAGSGQQAPIDAIFEASGGVPGEIHRLASQWARSEATRRFGAAAARAAEGRSDLRAVETELADNLVDLQLIREREVLYGGGEGTVIDGSRESPFKGLASFDTDDADLFYGRERLVAEMVGRLPGNSFLGIVGPSGSGKSSALRAGLLPAIASGVLDGSGDWLRVLFRPGANPLRALDRALWASLPESDRGVLDHTETPLRRTLEYLREVATDDQKPRRVVVAVDQFEEMFTLAASDSMRSRLVDELVAAATDPFSPALVIVALRADFYGRCAAYPALARLLGASHVLVGPMSEDEFRRAIAQPAIRAGLRVEPALVDTLVAEVVDEPGALPLLSSALLELWQHRQGRLITFEAYSQTGGVRGAVGRLAEEAYARLADDERPVARAVLLRLAGPGPGETVVRRRVPLAEFDTANNERIATVIRVLTDARLLTASEGTLEVAHEALLREWPRLQEWLDEDRAGQVLHAHLIEAAKEWDDTDRDTGELYRGARLTSALDWTTDHNLELNELERTFLSASREVSERESDRQRRTNRRLRILLAGVAILLAVSLAAGGLAFVQGQRAEEQGQRAQEQGQRAQEQTKVAEAAATRAEASRLGAQAVVEDRLDTSLLLAEEALAIDDSIDTRSTLLATILRAPAAIRLLPGTGNRVLEIQGSADGSTILTADNIGGIALYDAASMQLERIVKLEGQASFGLTRDGSLAFGTTSSDGRPAIVLLTTADGSHTIQPLPDGADFAGEAYPVLGPDGSSFFTMETRQGGDSVLLVRRGLDGHELEARPLLVSDAGDLHVSPDGRRIFVSSRSAAQSWEIAVLEAATLKPERVIVTGTPRWTLAPDGQTIAAGGDDGSIASYDVTSGQKTVFDGRHNARVTGLGFSPDGKVLLSTGDDRDVMVWDVPSHSLREILHGHAGRAFGPAFDRDGRTAFTVGLDSRVIAWDLAGERRIGLPSRFDARNLDGDDVIAASVDGRLIALAQNSDPAASQGYDAVSVLAVDGPTHRWTAVPWPSAVFEGVKAADPIFPDLQQPVVTAIAFSPDGRLLAVAGQNLEVVLYDVATGHEVRRWRASHTGWVNDLSFAPDGSLLTANDDGRVVTWDVTTGSEIRELRVRPEATSADSYVGAPTKVRASPDGTRIAVASFVVDHPPQRVAAYDTATGERLFDVDGDLFNTTIEWSPDGSMVATGGWQSGRVSLLDARSGAQTLEPAQAAAGFVLSLGFAWDGGLLVTGGTDGTVRLFDTNTLKPVGAELPAPNENEGVFAFVQPSGGLVAVQSAGRILRWELDPKRWAAQACSVANRQLTESEWRAFLPDRPYAPSCGP